MSMPNDDREQIGRLRNSVAYGGSRNSLIEWTLSPEWSAIPGFMNIRGECITRYISTKTKSKLVKIVANGMVSGEIQCR